MNNVHDVAAYIVRRRGATTTKKFQKLIYYAQAWSLVWHGQPLFRARIEAWRDGPVCPAVFFHHRREFRVSEWPEGNADRLSARDRNTIDRVLRFYGDRSPEYLVDMTHREAPWLDARGELPPTAKSKATITHDAMREFYRGEGSAFMDAQIAEHALADPSPRVSANDLWDELGL